MLATKTVAVKRIIYLSIFLFNYFYFAATIKDMGCECVEAMGSLSIPVKENHFYG